MGQEAERLYTQTDKAIVACWGGTSFGDIGSVPGMGLKRPRGIRDVGEWYIRLAPRERRAGLSKTGDLRNVQARTPVENLLAMYQAVRDYGHAVAPLA